MTFSILLVKETRAGEQRVALLPQDVKHLTALGHRVVVESGAGMGVGQDDAAYLDAGGEVRGEGRDDYADLFADINLVVRVKRAQAERERLELVALRPGVVMVGALDPNEVGSDHVQRYQAAQLQAYSLDYLDIPRDNPMNILSQMSQLTGKLALQDAIAKCNRKVKHAVIIGFGAAGEAAFYEAVKRGLHTTVFCTRVAQKNIIEQHNATAILLDKTAPLADNQQLILEATRQADVVLTAARSRLTVSPILIPATTLAQLQPGTVIVDLALSDGGNVEGALHDETRVTDQGVIITNVSGYPKQVPQESSAIWSRASVLFIEQLGQQNPLVKTARIV